MPHATPDAEATNPITVEDVKVIAKQRLDPAVWDYYTTGADEEQSVRRNEQIFKKYGISVILVSLPILITSPSDSSSDRKSYVT